MGMFGYATHAEPPRLRTLMRQRSGGTCVAFGYTPNFLYVSAYEDVFTGLFNDHKILIFNIV